MYALASLISASLVLQTKPSQQESAEARIEGPAPVEEALRLLDLGIMVRLVRFVKCLHGMGFKNLVVHPMQGARKASGIFPGQSADGWANLSASAAHSCI